MKAQLPCKRQPHFFCFLLHWFIFLGHSIPSFSQNSNLSASILHFFTTDTSTSTNLNRFLGGNSNNQDFQFIIKLKNTHCAIYQLTYLHLPVYHVTVSQLISAHSNQSLFLGKNISYIASKIQIYPNQTGWKLENNYLIPVIQSTQENEIIYIDCSTQKIIQSDNRKIFAKKDSNLLVMLCSPDILTISNKQYRYPYADRQDSSFAEFEQYQTNHQILCKTSGDSFFLESDKIHFKEISNPAISTPIFKNPSSPIFPKRNLPEYEFLNVFFHLQNVAEYWKKLGFAYLADTVNIDPHALSGADESAFDRLSNPPNIEFGNGGVDDAEDADAIVHEYTHAAMHSIHEDAYIGTERQSVEEGICDFSAAVYSLLFSPNHYGEVFNWDGHNEFWSGRNLNNNRKYPKDKTGQTHIDGQIFGAALWDLGRTIGFDSTLALLFESIPLMQANISMKQAAKNLLLIDSLNHQGKYQWAISRALALHGLHDTAVLQTKEIRNKPAFVVLGYENGFLEIDNFMDSQEIYLYSLEGKIILRTQLKTGKNFIAINHLGFLLAKTPVFTAKYMLLHN